MHGENLKLYIHIHKSDRTKMRKIWQKIFWNAFAWLKLAFGERKAATHFEFL